jgi:putative ABC transport system substrate-binding protein
MQIETAVNDLGSEPGGGLVVTPDMFTIYHRRPIISAAARNNVPAVYWLSDFVSEELSCATDHSGPTIGWMGPLPRCRSYSGGLLAYGPDLADNWRRAATYVDRILKGEKPADLPVQAPTKYELVINLKTAKALGLTVPDTLLARADEILE